jgi:hypothetical protein
MHSRFIQGNDCTLGHFQAAEALTIISKISSSHRENARLRAAIASIPGFMKLLIRSWVFEADNMTLNKGESLTKTFTMYLAPFFIDEDKFWNEKRLVQWLDADPDYRANRQIIAQAALGHLSYNFSERRPLYLQYITADVNFLTMLCFPLDAGMRFDLLTRRSAHHIPYFVSKLLCNQLYPRGAYPDILEFALSCFIHLETCLETMKAESWIRQAIEGSLLHAIVSANRWLTLLNAEEHEKYFNIIAGICARILSDLLPKYLVYYSVMKMAKKALRKNAIHPTRLRREGTSSGPLWNLWVAFVDTVERSYDISMHHEKFHSKFICHNPEVSSAHF